MKKRSRGRCKGNPSPPIPKFRTKFTKQLTACEGWTCCKPPAVGDHRPPFGVRLERSIIERWVRVAVVCVGGRCSTSPEELRVKVA